MARRKAIPHDPFHDPAPQVPAHVPPPAPPELGSIDDDASRGGKNVRPNVIEDEGFSHAFKHEPEHTKEYKYFDRGKK